MSMVLSKAIGLIDLVADGLNGLKEISEAAQMSRSTTHRLLATLVEHHYLAYENKQYKLGLRLLELGEVKKRSMSFLDACRPVLVRYAEITGDTIHLAILDEQDIVLLDRVFGNRQLRINSYPGLRNHAFMTAVGKVLISKQPENDWPHFLENIHFSYTKTPQQLRDELKQAKTTNVAIDIDECNVGTCGIASSFRINEGLNVACSINGATVYFSDERMKELIPVVQQLAAELEQVASQHLSPAEIDFRGII